MAFRHQSKGHAFTTRSQAAKEAERLRPNSDIFKVTVLGLAKTGKTSMCTQIVNHFFPQVYRHTSQTDSFITRVTVNDAMGETTPVIAHSRDPIDRYQLELQDTPGEIWRKESGGGVDASEVFAALGDMRVAIICTHVLCFCDFLSLCAPGEPTS